MSTLVTENEWKNDFKLPPYLKLGSLLKYQKTYGCSDNLRDAYGLLNPGSKVGIEELKEIKQMLKYSTPVKMIVKGVMSREDALLVTSIGADHIWISNGRKD